MRKSFRKSWALITALYCCATARKADADQSWTLTNTLTVSVLHAPKLLRISRERVYVKMEATVVSMIMAPASSASPFICWLKI